MSRLCAFKNFFGAPRTGLHNIRIFNIAIVDVLATFLVAWALSYYTGYRYIWVLLALFLLGIFLHWLFCVDTTVNRWLFGPYPTT